MRRKPKVFRPLRASSPSQAENLNDPLEESYGSRIDVSPIAESELSEGMTDENDLCGQINVTESKKFDLCPMEESLTTTFSSMEVLSSSTSSESSSTASLILCDTSASTESVLRQVMLETDSLSDSAMPV